MSSPQATFWYRPITLSILVMPLVIIGSMILQVLFPFYKFYLDILTHSLIYYILCEAATTYFKRHSLMKEMNFRTNTFLFTR